MRKSLGNLDVETEHGVSADFKRLNSSALNFLCLIFGYPSVSFGREVAQFVKLCIVSGGDEIAFCQNDIGLFCDSTVDEIDNRCFRYDARLDVCKSRTFGGKGVPKIRYWTERGRERVEVACVCAPRIDFCDQAFKVTHPIESGLQERKRCAVVHKRLNRIKKERVEKINAADANIFTTEKNLKEYGDKIPADKKGAIEAALGKLKEAHKSADIAAIDTAIAELNNAWQAASQDIYAAQQAAQGAQANAGANPGAGAAGEQTKAQPEDVEFEEVK